MNRTIGRFEIRGELGRGAQSTVYLGFDPQLQREVAIKTLQLDSRDPSQNASLLAEARAVSKLRHPNIVPIFDAGEEAGQLYLVFEYVPGQTLAAFLRQSGPSTPVKALFILRPVLDAIAQAHARGIIHRDLKPSNILLDENGTPRVMDFGIAAQVDAPDEAGDAYSGTPAYMAPEYIARRECTERADVFAAGLVLFEMLAGRRAVEGDNLFQILHRLVNEDLQLPQNLAVDERLAGILAKALVRDPALRYQNVPQFIEALDGYLDPEEEVRGDSVNRQSTIDFLLRRMRHKSDFPALSESVSAINRIANSETESINKLSNAILKDFALTNKLLRLVNSAYFRPAGGGTISTVSRAVIVLGFDAVRNIAITVLLFEHLQNKNNAAQLQEAFLRANFAGVLAKGLGSAAKMRDLEQSFICALFHSLGRLLAQYYFPDEAEEIRRLAAQKSCSDEQASLAVLGISYQDLGIAIARLWGFPPLIVSSMQRLSAGPLKKPASSEERLRLLSGLSNELCDVIANSESGHCEREMKRAMARFHEALPVDDETALQTVRRSIEEISEFSRLVHLNIQQTVFGRQMRQFSQGGAGAKVENDPVDNDTLASTRLIEVLPGAVTLQQGKVDAQAVLTAGIQDISNSLVDGYKLNDILRIILETMYRAMGFKRVILCIRDAKSGMMQGRFGFGPETAEVTRNFRFTLSFTPDIFHAATSKGVDILISDLNDAKIAQRIPDWYRKLLPTARSLILLPLNIKTNPVAIIYADCDEAGGIEIPEKELSLLRTLRNQAVLAIKQGG